VLFAPVRSLVTFLVIDVTLYRNECTRHKKRSSVVAVDLYLAGEAGSQRVEVWRKLQRYGAVPLGNSGVLWWLRSSR